MKSIFKFPRGGIKRGGNRCFGLWIPIDNSKSDGVQDAFERLNKALKELKVKKYDTRI